MKGEQGSVAVFAIIMMMVLSAMGAVLLTLSRTEVEIAINHRDGIAAQYVAEAGIQAAVAKLKTDPLLVEQTGRGSYITTSQALGLMPTIGTYTVQIGPDSITTNKNNRLITAVGVAQQAQRQVVVNVTVPVPMSESNSFIITWANKGE